MSNEKFLANLDNAYNTLIKFGQVAAKNKNQKLYIELCKEAHTVKEAIEYVRSHPHKFANPTVRESIVDAFRLLTKRLFNSK